jgi:hypothetical protein
MSQRRVIGRPRNGSLQLLWPFLGAMQYGENLDCAPLYTVCHQYPCKDRRASRILGRHGGVQAGMILGIIGYVQEANGSYRP